jgi:hypothetical protein
MDVRVLDCPAPFRARAFDPPQKPWAAVFDRVPGLWYTRLRTRQTSPTARRH